MVAQFVGALLVGFMSGTIVCWARIRYWRQRVRILESISTSALSKAWNWPGGVPNF